MSKEFYHFGEETCLISIRLLLKWGLRFVSLTKLNMPSCPSMKANTEVQTTCGVYPSHPYSAQVSL
jgi:hypothetical protein